jgi:hypothetical protein
VIPITTNEPFQMTVFFGVTFTKLQFTESQNLEHHSKQAQGIVGSNVS